jgi:hypothetical protein
MQFSRIIASVATVLLLVLLVVNQYQFSAIHSAMHPNAAEASKAAVAAEVSSGNGFTDIFVQKAAAATIPTGMPSVQGNNGPIAYGAELGISYDNAAATIAVLAPYEQDTRSDKLEGELLARYVDIGSRAACEFCCSARTMVFPDGSKACACAHSAAMRGLAAYLLTNHGEELSNDQILTEVNKLKATYFPRQSVEKVLAASSNGNVDTSTLNQLSPQVGGC